MSTREDSCGGLPCRMVELLFGDKTDDEIICFISSHDSLNLVRDALPDGRRLLELAIESDRLKLISWLCSEGGVSSDSVDWEGDPVIFLALDGDIDSAIQGGAELTFTTTKALVRSGASLDVLTRQGFSVRDFVSKYGKSVLLRFEERVVSLVRPRSLRGRNTGQQ